jgi:hypothetical protein
MRRMGEGKSSLYPVSKEIAKLSRMAIKKEEDVHLGDWKMVVPRGISNKTFCGCNFSLAMVS